MVLAKLRRECDKGNKYVFRGNTQWVESSLALSLVLRHLVVREAKCGI
jgi:hypothetical protein